VFTATHDSRSRYGHEEESEDDEYSFGSQYGSQYAKPAAPKPEPEPTPVYEEEPEPVYEPEPDPVYEPEPEIYEAPTPAPTYIVTPVVQSGYKTRSYSSPQPVKELEIESELETGAHEIENNFETEVGADIETGHEFEF
jgi:hypothetical protein